MHRIKIMQTIANSAAIKLIERERGREKERQKKD